MTQQARLNKQGQAYINTRIKALQDATNTAHDGIWREETKEQRESRINELQNLLDVMSSKTLEQKE